MPVDVEDIVQLCSTLAKDANLKATVKGSMAGGLIAGVGATVGGLVAGPIGIAAGAAAGGLAGAYITKNTFKPVHVVIQEMPYDQQRLLYDEVTAIVDKLTYTDLAMLLAIVRGDSIIKAEILGAVIKHVQGILPKMEIKD